MYVRCANPVTSYRGRGTPLAAMLLSAALASSAIGCSDVGQPEPTAPRISSDFLTVSAQQSVAPDGRFILQHSVLSPNIPEIDEGQARQLATAFVRQFAHFFVPTLEKDRGGTISPSDLQTCPRAFYAAGAYEAISVTPPAVIRKATGPQWIVPFCATGTPQLAVNVSAYATDAVLSKDRTSFTSMGEANFQIVGIPVGKQIPADPEDLARSVSQATGQRISTVPELVMRPRPMGPALAVWAITLDNPAKVSTTKKNWMTNAVFVGYFTDWQNQLLAADVDDLPAAPLDIEFNPAPGSVGNKATVTVTLRNA